MNLMLLPVIALLVFSYHYERNGNPWNFGETVSRILWACALAASYALLTMPIIYWRAPAMIPFAFLEILIPHAFAQRMGSRIDDWKTLQPISLGTIFGHALTVPKWWPAYWMKGFMDKLTFIQQDIIGMASTGCLRGILVFLPLIPLGLSIYAALAAAILQGITQPVSYLIGRCTPFAAFGNPPKSVEWGEFYIGIGWAVSLYVAAAFN